MCNHDVNSRHFTSRAAATSTRQNVREYHTVTSPSAGPTRREQRREQTVAEIKERAMAQVVTGGPEAVSLNGIARAMAMSPAALYRYFQSRDALLGELVVGAYDALADALEAAGRRRGPRRDELLVVARAFRRWALDHSNAYRLIFQTTSGSGQDIAPERTVAAATRSMSLILAALAGRSGSAPGVADPELGGVDPALASQIRAWGARADVAELPVRTLALGLTCWTRMHGIISLELGGHLAATGVDPGLLFEAEIRQLAALGNAAAR